MLNSGIEKHRLYASKKPLVLSCQPFLGNHTGILCGKGARLFAPDTRVPILQTTCTGRGAQMEKLLVGLYALIRLGTVISLASCGSNGKGPESSPWEDCAVGQILSPGGEPCTYPGRSEVLSVNEAGELCLDEHCNASDFRRHIKTENGKVVLELELTALGDGRYGITKLGNETRTAREILQGVQEFEEPVACYVGLTLGPGESCRHDDGTNFFLFEVKPDGDGCIGGICSGGSININDFSATKSGDTWTINSLP